jgi:hypothetical protein
MRVRFKNLDDILKRLLPKVSKAEQLLRSEQAKILYRIYASVLQDVICSGPQFQCFYFHTSPRAFLCRIIADSPVRAHLLAKGKTDSAEPLGRPVGYG